MLNEWSNQRLYRPYAYIISGSNILTSTEKLTASKADPQTQAPTAPRQGDPVSRVTFCQWRGVDAVTPEFPVDLHNTSPEYFRHHSCRSILNVSYDDSYIYVCQ